MIACVQKRSVGRGLVVWPLLLSSGGEVYGDWLYALIPPWTRGAHETGIIRIPCQSQTRR